MSGAAPPSAFKGLAVRGTVVALLAQVTKLGLYFAIAVVLARLLSPESFGLFGIVFAIIGILEIAKDGGMIVPVVQTERLTDGQSNWLFWFNAVLGAALALVAVAAAPIVSWIFADRRLAPIMDTMALVFLLGGLSTQHRALLRRQLRFRALAACEVAALAIGCATAVVAAWRGAGHWSLVSLYVTQEAALLLLVFLASDWRPGRPRRDPDVRSLVSFGGLMMGFELVAYLNYKFDNLIVGYALGPSVLGFYDKAYQLLWLPINQLNLSLAVTAIPILSRMRFDVGRYCDYLERYILLSAGLGIPMIVFLFTNADRVIEMVFGANWLPAAPIIRALAPAALVMTITSCVGWVFVSLGRTRRQMPWTIGVTAATLAAFFCGLPWGAQGVAAAFSITRAVLFVPTLIYTCAGTPVDWRWVLRIAARPAIAAAFALGVASLATAGSPEGRWLLFLNGAIFTGAYLLCWIVTPGGRAQIGEILTAGRALVGSV
jgi:PST family polysaccharide transporter